MRPILLALLCCIATASAAEPLAYDLAKLERIDGPSFRPADKQYPAELASAGVQGEVLVVVPLTAEGGSDGAVLGASSRSAQLDQVAVDFLKSVKFQIKEPPAKGWKAVVVPVEFYKDSVTTLTSKTCADFNADLAYQLSTFPERKPAEMRIFDMLAGVMYIGSGANPAQAAVLSKRSLAAKQPTIDACKASPKRMFHEVWQAAVKAASS